MSIRRKLFLIVAAVMIGISNIILEEERMVNDTTDKIEHVKDVNDNMKD